MRIVYKDKTNGSYVKLGNKRVFLERTKTFSRLEQTLTIKKITINEDANKRDLESYRLLLLNIEINALNNLLNNKKGNYHLNWKEFQIVASFWISGKYDNILKNKETRDEYFRINTNESQL